MNVELNNVHLNLNKIENNKILLVKVIERLSDGEIIIDLNGEKVKAKIDRELPDSFFAYVEKKVEKNNIKIILRMIENFKNVKESIADKNQLEIIKNFILSNSLPLIEDNIMVAIEILKKRIPLTIHNFEIVKYSLRKYEKFPSFIAEVIQSGKKIDKTFIDILYNIKEIITTILKNKADPSNVDLLNKLILLFNFLSDNKYNFNIRFEEDKFFLITRIDTEKENKRYCFDFCSDKIKNFLIIIDISPLEVNAKVYLEKDIIDNYFSLLENSKTSFIKKFKTIYSNKNIRLNFLEYNNNIFENEFFSENKNNIGNLDIII